jgi:hypothetical protein
LSPGENLEFFMGPTFKSRLKRYGLGNDDAIKEEISGQVTAWPLKCREVDEGLAVYTVTLPTSKGDKEFDVLCGVAGRNQRTLLQIINANEGGIGEKDIAYFITLIQSLRKNPKHRVR